MSVNLTVVNYFELGLPGTKQDRGTLILVGQIGRVAVPYILNCMHEVYLSRRWCSAYQIVGRIHMERYIDR